MSLLVDNLIENDFVRFSNIFELISWEAPLLVGSIDRIATNFAPFNLSAGYADDERCKPIFDMIMNRLEKVPIVTDKHGRLRLDGDRLGAEILDMFDGYILPRMMERIRNVGVFVNVSSVESCLYYNVYFNTSIQINDHMFTNVLFRFILRIN